MASTPSKKPAPSQSDYRQAHRLDGRRKDDNGPIVLTSIMFLGVAWILFQGPPTELGALRNLFQRDWLNLGSAEFVVSPLPLEMEGGDPHLRALMRTISASESNMSKPYHLLYGGKTIGSLRRHPEHCVPIVNGPNEGDCTTAAGRYQFLDKTWQTKAAKYHPESPSWYAVWADYSFEPQYQDIVVYNWLADSNAWGVDIVQLLKEGQINTVLKTLSGTWTSLGYGIETNSMSSRLPSIYQEMLAEEQANTDR